MIVLPALLSLAFVGAPSGSDSAGPSGDGAGVERDPGTERALQPLPPPTPWALAGARPWKECREAERHAMALRRGGAGSARGTLPDAGAELLWSRRAERCPHAPTTVGEAAQQEIVAAGTLLRGVEEWGADDAKQLEEVAVDHRRRLTKALRWLDAALAESERRGERPPRQTQYYRAYALAGLGRLQDARIALRDTVIHGDIETWRADRMAALVEIIAGDLERAIGLAEHAVRATDGSGPTNDGAISRYIRAFVLDRAGSPAFARDELRALRRESSSLEARDAVESVLPIHERLFLRAIDATANAEDASALRLWDAYLSRPEPLPPERVLAERHRAELAPPPPVVRPE